MAGPFSIRLQVRYSECDQQGHVFNAHYLTWLDMAHSAFLSHALGLSYPQIRAAGIDVVVAESWVRYRSPASEDEELTIEVRLDSLTRTSMTSRYTILRGERLVAEASLRHVCVAHGSTDKLPWPAEFRAALERHIA